MVIKRSLLAALTRLVAYMLLAHRSRVPKFQFNLSHALRDGNLANKTQCCFNILMPAT